MTSPRSAILAYVSWELLAAGQGAGGNGREANAPAPSRRPVAPLRSRVKAARCSRSSGEVTSGLRKCIVGVPVGREGDQNGRKFEGEGNLVLRLCWDGI